MAAVHPFLPLAKPCTVRERKDWQSLAHAGHVDWFRRLLQNNGYDLEIEDEALGPAILDLVAGHIDERACRGYLTSVYAVGPSKRWSAANLRFPPVHIRYPLR